MEEQILKGKYNIPLDMFEKAFVTFQKKFVYPKNIIATIIFIAVAVIYGYGAFRNSDPMYAMLAVVCLVLIFSVWINPLKVRSKLMKSIAEIKDDFYNFELYDNKVSIGSIVMNENGEEEYVPPAVIDIQSKVVQAVETKDYTIIYIKNHVFYVIPKKDFDFSEQKIIADTLKKSMGKRYSETDKL